VVCVYLDHLQQRLNNPVVALCSCIFIPMYHKLQWHRTTVHSVGISIFDQVNVPLHNSQCQVNVYN